MSIRRDGICESRSMRRARPRSAGSRRASSPCSPRSRTSRSRTPGAGSSTRAAASARSSAPRTPGASPMRRATRGLARGDPLRRSGVARQALRLRYRTDPAGSGPLKTAALPAGAGAIGGHPADQGVHRPRGRQWRPSRRVAAAARPHRARLRLLGSLRFRDTACLRLRDTGRKRSQERFDEGTRDP